MLFSSYSAVSNVAPNYCIAPWVVKMGMFGNYDISLGGFLETFCFSPDYNCPNRCLLPSLPIVEVASCVSCSIRLSVDAYHEQILFCDKISVLVLVLFVLGTSYSITSCFHQLRNKNFKNHQLMNRKYHTYSLSKTFI